VYQEQTLEFVMLRGFQILSLRQ